MSHLKVGIAQFHSSALTGALVHVESLLKNGAELVVLPEKWMNGDNGNTVSAGHPFLDRISELSSQYSASVLTGALVEREGERTHITCYAYGPDGRLLARARKLHPFGIEKRSITPGTGITVFGFNGLRIGVAICYDMDFPETVRRFALADCDLIAVPTKIRKEGIEPWLVYLQARALENRIPIVFANEVNPPYFQGKSGVIDLGRSADGMVMYPRMRLLGTGEEDCLFELDPADYREERRKRMMDRNRVVDCLESLPGETDTDKFGFHNEQA